MYTITPTAVQMPSRHHVAAPSEYIMYAHTSAPAMHVNHGHGARNGRGRSGRVRRSTSTPKHTVTKAASVPIATSSPRIPTGNSPPMTAADTSVITVPVEGVRKRGCTRPKKGGKIGRAHV